MGLKGRVGVSHDPNVSHAPGFPCPSIGRLCFDREVENSTTSCGVKLSFCTPPRSLLETGSMLCANCDIRSAGHAGMVCVSAKWTEEFVNLRL